jgi:hypothetical protein
LLKRFFANTWGHWRTVSVLENGDTMGERIGQIGRIDTDFLGRVRLESVKNQKKIRVNPPNPPNPFSHSISIFQNRNYAPMCLQKYKPQK